ncbi:hypothetical protein MCHI_002089 [Candidatus Magnetoovum chiemensis]|nr:hypothetical protein MCHI_002089 [Candidatus Magnetoovum chiemensis]
MLLVHQINVTAQWRRTPCVLRHAQTHVGRSMGRHSHATHGRLHTINAGDLAFVQHATPFTVHVNHPLGHQQIQWCIAAAWLNFNGSVIAHIEIEINARVLLRLPAHNFALHSQHTRTFPQHFQCWKKLAHHLKLMQIGVFQNLFGQSRIQVIVAQVRCHGHLLNGAVGLADQFTSFSTYFNVNTDRWNGTPFSQGGQFNHLIGQHGDFVTGRIHSGQALAGHAVIGTAARNQERRRCNVHANARAFFIQPHNAECIINFRG